MLEVAKRVLLIVAVLFFLGAGGWLFAGYEVVAGWLAGTAVGVFAWAALLDGVNRIADATELIGRRVGRGS